VVTQLGSLFLRNIAMGFDAYLKEAARARPAAALFTHGLKETSYSRRLGNHPAGVVTGAPWQAG
jgi:hypothetical protein